MLYTLGEVIDRLKRDEYALLSGDVPLAQEMKEKYQGEIIYINMLDDLCFLLPNRRKISREFSIKKYPDMDGELFRLYEIKKIDNFFADEFVKYLRYELQDNDSQNEDSETFVENNVSTK